MKAQYSQPDMKEKPLTILALECSTSACSVALRQSGVLLQILHAEGRGQAEALVPLIASVMQATGLGWDAIDLIGVSVGPGSFTGLRIGLAAARGLALARNLPIAGVSTADLLAASVSADSHRDRTLLIAIDSKREDLFVQAFPPGGAPPEPLCAMSLDQITAWQKGPMLVVGDAADRFAGLHEGWETQQRLPDAGLLAALAEQRFRDGRSLPAHPLYVRAPDVSLPKS